MDEVASHARGDDVGQIRIDRLESVRERGRGRPVDVVSYRGRDPQLDQDILNEKIDL